MATIKQWIDEIDRTDTNELIKVREALSTLSFWEFFQKEFDGVNEVKHMIDGVLDARHPAL